MKEALTHPKIFEVKESDKGFKFKVKTQSNGYVAYEIWQEGNIFLIEILHTGFVFEHNSIQDALDFALI